MTSAEFNELFSMMVGAVVVVAYALGFLAGWLE